MPWAEFVDKNGDLTDPKNYIQGPQSNKPDPHQIGEYWEQNHPNWLQVSDSYVPPKPPPTTAQMLSSLDAEYQPQFLELSQALGVAMLADNALLITNLKLDYAELKDEYDTKRGEIDG